jgi:hypothetical protein
MYIFRFSRSSIFWLLETAKVAKKCKHFDTYVERIAYTFQKYIGHEIYADLKSLFLDGSVL